MHRIFRVNSGCSRPPSAAVPVPVPVPVDSAPIGEAVVMCSCSIGAWACAAALLFFGIFSGSGCLLCRLMQMRCSGDRKGV